MLLIEYQLQWKNRYGHPQEWITCCGMFPSMERFKLLMSLETDNGQKKNLRNVNVIRELTDAEVESYMKHLKG